MDIQLYDLGHTILSWTYNSAISDIQFLAVVINMSQSLLRLHFLVGGDSSPMGGVLHTDGSGNTVFRAHSVIFAM